MTKLYIVLKDGTVVLTAEGMTLRIPRIGECIKVLNGKDKIYLRVEDVISTYGLTYNEITVVVNYDKKYT